jgi:hypothetical protein
LDPTSSPQPVEQRALGLLLAGGEFDHPAGFNNDVFALDQGRIV